MNIIILPLCAVVTDFYYFLKLELTEEKCLLCVCVLFVFVVWVSWPGSEKTETSVWPLLIISSSRWRTPGRDSAASARVQTGAWEPGWSQARGSENRDTAYTSSPPPHPRRLLTRVSTTSEYNFWVKLLSTPSSTTAKYTWVQLSFSFISEAEAHTETILRATSYVTIVIVSLLQHQLDHCLCDGGPGIQIRKLRWET